ncbi:Multiple epidermal growth factor-like domains protein 6 [Holothuria leucospilota]|uniref:Multiple epidermal growth factor-like domains protein 6 n=1 Tax=Holothuria leucospilota TaxID=206669 RepID=A0A9Q1CNG8_HOLLE|nr:Multiple epidermal growth factor-like domains protein 6 [Holothuria leucospilota]
MATEGTDSTITVTCTLNPATALTRDARCALGVMAGVASSAENGWDVADVAGYPCTIVAGATVGTVDIPLNDDVVIDTGETLTIECATPSTGDTAGTAASFTINDGGLADAQLTVVPRFTLYKVSEEAGMLSIWVDTLDSNGNRAPNEDDIMIDLTFPTSATGEDTASSLDYDDTVGPITVPGSVNGIATSSFTLDLPMLTDALVENLETVNVLLMDMAPVVSVTSDSTTTISVQILDDDKPELVIVNAKPRLPRRSKQDVVLRAFNAVGSWDSFDLTWFPFNLKDFRTRDITTGNNIAVTETTLARPKYRTRTRFNEYRYSTTQTVSTVPYTLNAYAYVSTTSHSRSRAPIEASVGPTLTIWPLTIDGSGNCATIESTVISVPPNIYSNSMRWWFIKEGGTIADIRRLRQYNGRNWARISECDDAGLYIVLRSRRGKMGWIDHIRVIIAACPEGFTGPPTCMTAAPECRNGGVVDPVLALCSCPPGFAGTNCETGAHV